MKNLLKSIKFKFALSFVLLTLFISITLVVLSVYKSTQIVENEAYEKLNLYVGKNAEAFDSQIMSIEKNNQMLVDFITQSFDGSHIKDQDAYIESYKKILSPVVQSMAQNNLTSKSAYVFFVPELTQNPKSVWYADLNFDQNVERQEEFPKSYFNGDRIEKEWFYKPSDEGKSIWTNPYMGTVEADKTIQYTSFTSPVYIDGKLIAIVGTDFFINDITSVVSQIKLYETGYAYLMDDTFSVIIHPTLAMGTPVIPILENINPGITAKIMGKKSGQLEYKWTNEADKILVFYQLKNGWYFGVAPYKNEVFRDVISLRRLSIGIVFIGVVLALILGIVLEVLIHRKSQTITLTQQKLMEAEKIASLGYLVSGVAHEMNTPIGNSITLTTFIEGTSKHLIDVVRSGAVKKNELMSYLQDIFESSQQIYTNLFEAQRTITSFKDLASIKRVGQVQRIHVQDHVYAIFESIKHLNEDLKISLKYYGDKNILLTGDAQLFDQIVYNLLENSIVHGFYGRSEGRVIIEISKVEDGVQLIYKDDGVGIEPQMMSHIYVPFFSSKFSNKNRGLGMCVLFNIVNGPYRGRVNTESEKDEGVKIAIELRHFK